MLSVVMPLFNEGEKIFSNVEQTIGVLRKMEPFELIAVDDGSTDQSLSELQRARSCFPELSVISIEHLGKGEALRRGALAAKGEWVIFIDADLDLPPEQILLFLALQRTHKADVVVGSKMHPDSTLDYPWHRRLYSWGYWMLTRLLFRLPIRDTQTGLKLVRRDYLLKALEKTELKGFAFDLELLVRLVQAGAKMIEAPVVVNHQWKFGGIGLRTIGSILEDTWSTWKKIYFS